jgi:hypothetical protein
MKGVFGLLLIVFIVLSVYDYANPLDIPFFTENNPLKSVVSLVDTSTQETTSNVIQLPSYNLDFEYGTIGWHLHNLYSVPPDYWETTFEQSKSGRQSLRLAHTCTTTESGALKVEQTKQSLFRTDKLPAFDNNVYVKFYIKSLRKYENSWWDDPLYEFATMTSYSLNVEAIDEWGERIYSKDIIRDIYNYQNSQLVKIVEYDMIDEVNATEYFKKINGYDYNATYNGDLKAIQDMIDLQNSLTSGKVFYYVANTNTLPSSSYAVYLGDGWYTIIMPIPKGTRYLGFNSAVFCSGQNEYWSYGPMMTVYYPDAPASADTLTYIDGITFIRVLSDSTIPDVLPTSTIDTTGNTWTTDEDIIDDADDDDNTPPVTNNKFMIWIKTWWWVPIFIILAFLAGLSSKTPKTKKKVRKSRKVQSK